MTEVLIAGDTASSDRSDANVLLSDGCLFQVGDRVAGTLVGKIGMGLAEMVTWGIGTAVGVGGEQSLVSGSVVDFGRVDWRLVNVGLVSMVSREATFFSFDCGRSQTGRTLMEVTCCHGVANSISSL